MMSVSVFSTGVIFLLFVGLGWPAMVDGSHSISYDDDDIDDGYYIDDVFINSISVTRRVRNIQPLIVKNTDIFCLMFSGLPMGLHLTVE